MSAEHFEVMNARPGAFPPARDNRALEADEHKSLLNLSPVVGKARMANLSAILFGVRFTNPRG
jgi:hypothetical protein